MSQFFTINAFFLRSLSDFTKVSEVPLEANVFKRLFRNTDSLNSHNSRQNTARLVKSPGSLNWLNSLNSLNSRQNPAPLVKNTDSLNSCNSCNSRQNAPRLVKNPGSLNWLNSLNSRQNALRFALFYGLFLSFLSNYAQNPVSPNLTGTYLTTRFAGSTGLFSVGLGKTFLREKFDFSVLAGYVPKNFGGVLTVAGFRGVYNPFSVPVGERFSFEPLQTGFFTTLNFGERQGLGWGEQYPKGYYWWNRNLRFHVLFGTQFSVLFDEKHLKKLSFYLETNTNDVYIASLGTNLRRINLSDIFFLGFGVKGYF